MDSQELVLFTVIHNQQFEDAKKRSLFCVPMDGFETLLSFTRSRRSDILSLCEMPLMDREQEQYLFRQYNCLKYRANLFAVKGDKVRYSEICGRIQDVKDVIFCSNVRLCVNYLKRMHLDTDTFQLRFSDTCEPLIKAIEGFDYALGFKFSTYCTWALIRSSMKQKRSMEMVYADPDTLIDVPVSDHETSWDEQHIRALLQKANLDPRTIWTICESLGLFSDKKRILKDIGKDMGITKERVRQIKLLGIKKLRAYFRDRSALLEAV